MNPRMGLLSFFVCTMTLVSVVLLAQKKPLAVQNHQVVGWKIDLNHAPAETLQLLPNVGPKIAKRIVAYRTTHGPMMKLEQLKEIQAVGVMTLKRVRPFAFVQ